MQTRGTLTATALDQLLRAVGDPLVTLSGVGPEHPDFEEAQLLRAGVGVLAKTPTTFPLIADAISALRHWAGVPRTEAHVAAAEAWLAGEPALAAERFAAIAKSFPDDLLALRLALSSFFFVGARARACEVVDDAMDARSPGDSGFGFVLAMASFAHAENHDPVQAEALGRRALEPDRACPVGVHAVAHAMAESGRARDGARWMREQSGHWATESRMRTHNAWHLAMFDAEAGDLEAALRILDECLLPASTTSALDACDTASLLWRLDLDAAESCDRWRKLSTAFADTMTAGFWPYVDVHAALAHTFAGERSRGRTLVETVARRAEERGYAASRARLVTLPFLQALDAFAEGRRDELGGAFTRLRSNLDALGGSTLQLAMIESIARGASEQRLIVPCRRAA